MINLLDSKEKMVLQGAILCCILFACATIFEIGLLNYIGMAVALMVVVLYGPENAVLLIFFLCPNTSFVVIGGSSLSGYLSLVCFLMYLYKSKYGIPIKSFVASVVFIVYVSISCLLNNDYTYLFGFVKMISDVLLLLMLIYNEEDKVKKIIILSYSYVYGAVLGGILGLADFLITGRGINVYGTVRLKGIFGDGNYYSVAIAFAIALLFVLVLYQKKFRLTDMFMFATLTIIGFETISRGFLISFALVGAIFVIYFIFSRQMKVAYKISSLFLITLFIVITLSKTDIMDRYVVRMTSNDLATGNGRLDLWTYYLDRLFSSPESPWIGLGSSIKAISLDASLQMEHNTYVQFLYSIGFVGVFLFVFMTIFFYIDAKVICSPGKKTPLLFLPLVSTLSSVFFISAMTWENFIYPLFWGLVIMSNLRNNELRMRRYVLSKKIVQIEN